MTDLSADEITLPVKRTDGDTLEERLTANAYHNILPARYLKQDRDGNFVEQQEDLFDRVAKNIALAETVYEAQKRGDTITATPDQLKPDHPRRDELAAEVFGAGTTVEDDVTVELTEDNINKFAYDTIVPDLPGDIQDHVTATKAEFQTLMEDLSFIPNSPTLMNAGDELQQLSACFVDSPADDLTDIHQTAKEAAEVFQCLTADATVHVAEEGPTSVADVEDGDAIRQRDPDGGYRYRTVTATHRYVDAPVHRVQTAAGIQLTGTPNHELLVDDDWTRIDEIDPGDHLAVSLNWIPDSAPAPSLPGVATGPQWGKTRTVDNADIETLYAEGHSDYEIAAELDCSASTVQRRRSMELDLPPNGSGGRPAGSVSFDTDTFADLYADGATDGELATTLGASTAAVGAYRNRHDLDPNGTPVKTVTQPSELTPQLAELLGMWIGDGSKHEDGIRFHLRRESVLDRADHLCRELFDTPLDARYDEGCYDAVIHSHELKRYWLEHFGDAKPTATEAQVPDILYETDRETVAAFLRGLFTTEGSLQNDTYPRFWTASETLVEDVQQLLLGLGIPAATWEYDVEHRDYYNVGPTGAHALEAFADRVGFVDDRWATMQTSLEAIDSKETRIGTVVDETTWHVPVESVEAVGTDTVYDLTVAGDHEYLADAIVSHNSGGGLGYAFWQLRPYGDPVGSTGGIASGPVTFMETYDQLCFPPGTNILTPSGQTQIEHLQEGDTVIDGEGTPRPITETMDRHVDEDLIEIHPKRRNEPLQATREHPFKVATDDGFEWVDAKDIDEGDRLVLGHSAVEQGPGLGETIDLSSIASGPLVFTDGGITINRDYYGATKGHPPASLAQEVAVEALATVAGWYLAEGCVVYRRGLPSEVTFTLHDEETEASNEIQAALDEFGVDSRVERVPDRNTRIVHVESSSFAQVIEGLFGTGAAEKRVPEFLWQAPIDVQARLVEALFDGDGRIQHRGDSQRLQLTLVNEEIVDFVYQVGLRCGVHFSRHNREEPEGKQPTYNVNASVSTAIGTPLQRLFDELPDGFRATDRTKQAHGRDVVAVRSVETVAYEGAVHNIEVPETHSYVADDVVVHNCETIAQGGTRRGAQMGVMRVSHPDVIEFIHAKNKDVSLAHSLRLNDPDDYTYTTFSEALEEARGLIDEDGRVPEHLRNAVEGHLSNFNISVGIGDEFMAALEAGEEYTFTNPRTGEAHVATEETKEMYSRYGLGDHVEVGEELSIPAERIWERIVEGAHENGEPGVIYLDRVNDEHSFDIEEHPDHEILATNPCVTGDTRISTAQGLVTAEDLYDQGVATDVVVDGRLAEEHTKEASSVYKTGEKDVYRLTTEEGYELRLTADHRVMTDDGWVEAQDLEVGDAVHLQNRKGGFGQHGSAAEGRVFGWLVGDGRLDHGEERAVLNFDDDDGTLAGDFAADVNEIVHDPLGNADDEVTHSGDARGAQAVEQRIRSGRLYELADEAGLVQEPLQVPEAVMQGSEAMARGFLQALFTADGHVEDTLEKGFSARLTSTSAALLQDVQQLLLNFGIRSQLHEDRNPAGSTELPDGTDGTNSSEPQGRHQLVVSAGHLVAFDEEIGFLAEEQQSTLEEAVAASDRGSSTGPFDATVASVAYDGHEAVYDLTEPDTSSFVADGVVVHNCGEQPLEEYEACNLGHINLSTIAAADAPDWRVWSAEHADEYDSTAAAVDAFLEAAIDTEELEHRIEYGTRFLENVVTMSDFPVPEIEAKVAEMRKIGLGIMGLAQLYIQLGIKYGSETGNEVARQLMTEINHSSKWASHELAEERDSFDEWGNSKYADPTRYADWFEHQTGLDADRWAEGFPIRNHNTTTIAPTGTTSMVGNTTGGCEPIYNVAYYKNVSDDVQGDEMLVEFDDYFLRVLEANDVDVDAVKKEAEAQMADNAFEGVEGLASVPDAIGELFVITEDLSGKDHAAVQCACQEGVDSAISKTCNFPNSATVEDMEEVYRFIYEHGGKGVTVYRDGTRSKQVLTTRAQNTDFAGMDEEEAAAAIAEEITERFGGLAAFLDREAVAESLGDLEDLGGDRRSVRPRPDTLHGVSQRIETGYGKLYVTINEDPETGEPFELFANIGHSGGYTNSFTEALAKTISTALRSGVDPEEIVDELQGTRSPKVAWDKGEQINSIPDAIGTALGRYIEGDIDRQIPQQRTLEETADEVAEETPPGEPTGDGGAAEAASTADMQSIIEAGESPECPDCGAMTLVYTEGCKTCQSCGWSEC